MVSDRRVDLKVIEGTGPRRPSGPPPGWARRARRFLMATEPGLRPVDVLLVGYLLLTAALLVGFSRNVPMWALHVAAHVVAIVAIFRVAAARPRHRVLLLLRDWYPILAFIPLYAELNSLTHLFTSVRHDALVAGWEAALFGGQPSQTLRHAWSALGVSEYLHFAYFYYYFVPTTLALWLYARGERAEFSEALTATLTAFLACCLLFMVFPVVGPYHHFTHAGAATWPGFFAPLTHAIVERGSSLGTAFPSSHTAVAVCVWLTAWRLCRPAFWALAAIVPALALGTVYGGFHYALDTLAGTAVGVLCALAAPRIHAALAARIHVPPAPEASQSFASQGRGPRLE